MKYQIIRLDRRYRWHETFQYAIEFTREFSSFQDSIERIRRVEELRVKLTEAYGPSVVYEFGVGSNSVEITNEPWLYVRKRSRFYLRDHSQLTWLLLQI